MAVLAHLLRPFPATRRAYSVFSKPGGGRYFNSAKPPKVAPSTKKVDASNTNGDASSSGAGKDQPSSQSSGGTTTPEGSSLTAASPSFTSAIAVHPSINPHDLKLHQFFSLHRPLLTISQPVSSIFESIPAPFTLPPGPSPEASSLSKFDDPPEASLEADADTARQLARVMVVNRIGASMAWEGTLKRLGLDVTEGRADEVRLAEAEFEVLMDSTKRKRRKKMKKHKLKKRRRLSRAQRVKIGR